MASRSKLETLASVPRSVRVHVIGALKIGGQAEENAKFRMS